MTHHDYDNHGHMGLPNPMDPASGWTEQPSNGGYGIAHAPDEAPSGTVFVPGLNTYVDADVAASLGLGAPQGATRADGTPVPTALDPRAVPAGGDPDEWVSDEDLDELSDEELEALADELEVEAEREPSLSETFDDIADCFDPAALKDAIDTLVVSGDPQDSIARIAEATGLDHAMAAQVAQTAVDEVADYASEAIGGDRWSSLVYAASRTPDPFARRVVADFVTGKLSPAKLGDAYDMWWHSLPDADEE